MRWINYSLLIIGIYLLVVLQTAFFTAWGIWGAMMHPVLWSIIYFNFFSKKNLWLLIILGGFMLDIVGLSFGMHLIALAISAMFLNFVHRYHLAISNLFSWILSSLAGIISYLFALFILNHSVGIIWQWPEIAALSWERAFMFTFLNLIALIIIFAFYKLYIYISNVRR
ncbi:hypothetical protein ISR92_02050 [Patescibacteria group bacterium]|nr:hypothetical protein [Patescibacteria group bacterium]